MVSASVSNCYQRNVELYVRLPIAANSCCVNVAPMSMSCQISVELMLHSWINVIKVWSSDCRINGATKREGNATRRTGPLRGEPEMDRDNERTFSIRDWFDTDPHFKHPLRCNRGFRSLACKDVYRLVHKCLQKLRKGFNVLLHCRFGLHRSGAFAVLVIGLRCGRLLNFARSIGV